MFQRLHDTIALAAERSPRQIAFRCGKAALDYASLDEQSSRLATFLVNQGLRVGERVGVFMPRCVETSVAIYGILKAGGVMVPVDPHVPAAGLVSLIDDCGMRHLLTQPKLESTAQQVAQSVRDLRTVIGVGEAVLPQDDRFHLWSAFEDSDPAGYRGQEVGPDDAAYIMYSSGSTGRSKGITHTHASGLAYARLSTQTYQVTPQDVIANHSPISFDMSTFGYFSSCYAGATTVLIPEAHTKVPVSLAGLIEAEKITIWYSVPLALIQLLTRTSLETFDFSALRWVKFGGEPFPPKHARALMKLWPGATFSNVYGPAEVNQCTYFHIPPEFATSDSLEPIPIGKVWDESSGLLIDDNDQILSELSAEGELVIQSPTRMKGYWGRPERDAVAYFRHPQNDGLFYRTGDIVRRTKDGNYTFVGRKDRQIKVRGYRVELDDVENAIASHPSVEEVGVFCVGEANGKEIRATVIVAPGQKLTESELRSHLASKMSPYAVPSQFEFVQTLPRTISGKIDRKKLRDTRQDCQTHEC